MRLTYWKANENFKAAEVPATLGPHQFQFFNHTVNVLVGAVFEARFALPNAGGNTLQWPGFLLERKDGGAVTVAVDSAARCVVSLFDSAAHPNVTKGAQTWD